MADAGDFPVTITLGSIEWALISTAVALGINRMEGESREITRKAALTITEVNIAALEEHLGLEPRQKEEPHDDRPE